MQIMEEELTKKSAPKGEAPAKEAAGYSLLKLPKPVSEKMPLRGQPWKISLYEKTLSAWKTPQGSWDGAVIAELERHLPHKLENNFLKQIPLKGVPYLIGFMLDRREIVIGSPRLAYESFLIQETKKSHGEGTLENLRAHIQKFQEILDVEPPSVIEQITDAYNLPTFFEEELQPVLRAAEELEEGLLQEMRKYRAGIFERVTDFFLNLSARYSHFRIHLLKFVALLASLEHDAEGLAVKRLFLEALRRLEQDAKKDSFPALYLMMFQIIHFFVKISPPSWVATIVRGFTTKMARRFIAGESIEKAEKVLNPLFTTNRDATIDQLGELVVSDKEADQYLSDVLKLIRGLSQHVKKGNRNWAGIQRAHISVKVSALSPDFNPAAPEYTFALVAPRLKKILIAAKKEEVFVNIDAEHYPFRDLTFYIFRRVLLETSELKNFTGVGIALQAYLRDATSHFEEILSLAKKRSLCMPVRLVKGAYWDAETIDAAAHSYDPPQFINKEETDIHLRQLAYKILEAGPHLQLCLGSHNFADHCFAEALRAERFPESPVIEHQCLHRTYEALSVGMARMHWPVRNYITVGSLLSGMAYLVRRILENSSQMGILAISRAHKEKNRALPPHLIHQGKKEAKQILRDDSISKLGPSFFNTPPLRFYKREEKAALDKAFEKFGESLGQDYSTQEHFSGLMHKVFSPSDPKIMVGQILWATPSDCRRVIDSVAKAYNLGSWPKAAPLERSSILLKAADLMLKQRLELTSLIVFEGGKNFKEAIADVDEAIDYLNFYAREETKRLRANKNLVSRGVFAVIAPWNFPLALPAGMVAGALAAGNHVILKPAETTPLVAKKFMDILYEAGVPKDVFFLLPGRGSEIGKILVEHSKVHGVVFTGSREIGLWIAHTAGKRIARNELFSYAAPAKVITEMGGKNAMIVTETADLNEAISGILYSAFGNAGQKCSAASRVLVDEKILGSLAVRLKEACQDIHVGPAFEHSTCINPLISEKEKQRLQNLAKEACQEALLFGGRVLVDRSKEDLPGACIGPTLIEIPALQALKKESSAQKELFGPILHLISYKDLNEAIQLFNATEYALTGGIYSQSQDETEFLQKRLEAGNIYVNRPCTGARVAIEPFGGFKLSGTGPKAGSPFYLDAFHVDCSAAEKVKAKGLAIDKEGMEQYKQFILQSLPQFMAKRRFNRKIPGQISFNDFSFVKQKGLYVALERTPNIKTFLYLLASLALGGRVQVLAPAQETLHQWNTICQHLYELGFTSDNISTRLYSQEKIKEAIAERNLQFVILEGDAEELEKILPFAYDETFAEKYMKTVLTKLDAPALQDFAKYLEPFILVRSFAVNTLRHGAPLEVEV